MSGYGSHVSLGIGDKPLIQSIADPSDFHIFRSFTTKSKEFGLELDYHCGGVWTLILETLLRIVVMPASVAIIGVGFADSDSYEAGQLFSIIVTKKEFMRIPVVFASKHCNDMLNPVFLEAPHGKAWEVEVENSEGQIWLAQGWKEFSNYYSISIGNFLIFRYNARAHFDVTIFDLSGAEIKYPIDDSMDISDHSTESLSHGPLVEEEDDIPVNLQTSANVIEEEKDDIPVNLQTNANVIEEEEPQGK
ncbi:B3 domain-containing transcription factor VRN1-like [Solanum dulcamara]|uniref:B3 domain-containing transcription factor VRN1-like n=1 Tax=Solanum dulcamara TaxID=45834 RepID=UPI0024867A14|nr:B3 domain-containing transcription factor VRN1-like [Solanum dulcamara]